MPAGGEVVVVVARSEDPREQLFEGPLKHRRCTDVGWLALFLAHAALFWGISVNSLRFGNPYKLFLPRDFSGAYCGLGPEWNGGRDLRGFPNLAFSLNVAAALDAPAQALACQLAASDSVSAVEYQRACADPSSLTALAAANTSAYRALFEGIADPSKAAGLFVTAGGRLGSSVAMLGQAPTFLNAVCVASCVLNQSVAKRSQVYGPPEGAVWAGLWERYRGRLPGATLAAWAPQACPYSERYCTPFPGVEFAWGWNHVCLLRMDRGIVSTLGNQLAANLQGLANVDLAERFGRDAAASIGDLQRAWDVFCMVAIVALVIGVAYLVLLRFCIKPVVWLSVLLVLVLFVAAAAAGMVRARQCAGHGFLDAPREAVTRSVATLANAARPMGSNGSAWNGVGMNLTELVESYGACADDGGFAIQSRSSREALDGCAKAMLACAALWGLLILCLWRRIRLACVTNQVAAQFVANTPEIVLVPAAQIAVGLLWVAWWISSAAFLVSQVPDNYVPTGAFATEAEAAGSADTPGACSRHWPAGFAWRMQVDCDNSTGIPRCWRCSPPRYMLDYRFAFAFFSFLWHNALLIAMGKVIVAGAVGAWFFAPRKEKSSVPKVLLATRNALGFHLGSLAFGSLILSIVQFLRWWLFYLNKQAKVQRNRIAQIIFAALGCLLWCFEKCVRFLNKNAYIQVALRGTNFCTSAKEGFFLVARNWVRFGVIAMLGPVIHFIGTACVVVVTAVLGYLMLQALHPDVAPVLPVAIYAAEGYVAAKLLMNVFGSAVDTTIQCFIITEEAKYRGDFVPKSLQSFIQERDLKGDPRCCGFPFSKRVSADG